MVVLEKRSNGIRYCLLIFPEKILLGLLQTCKWIRKTHLPFIWFCLHQRIWNMSWNLPLRHEFLVLKCDLVSKSCCFFISSGLFFVSYVITKNYIFILSRTDWLCMRSHQLGVGLMTKSKMELFLPILWIVKIPHVLRYAYKWGYFFSTYIYVINIYKTLCFSLGSQQYHKAKEERESWKMGGPYTQGNKTSELFCLLYLNMFFLEFSFVFWS